jgi:murein DD-endopeptidase MepM/ murein hydrolase activator NlpD
VVVAQKTPVVEIDPFIHISNNFDEITCILPVNIEEEHFQFIDSLLNTVAQQSLQYLLYESIQDDSLSVLLKQMINNDYMFTIPSFEYESAAVSGDSLFLQYKLNKALLNHFIRPYIDLYGHPGQKPIAPLFTSNHLPPAEDSISELKLLLPCENVPVPERALLLPNAPRNYRNGTHRGIDFYVNWGSPVRAVADGVVIRADQHYEEVPSEFRKKLLSEAKQLGHTPSDVFEHILVGQSVYIDHGFDLVPGYRTVSIYAHLSHVKPEIKPGASVSVGQQIGLSGNSGTEHGTLGTRKGAHLHWELILQDAGGEYYLGQGWDTEKLYQELVRVFSE